MQRDGRDDCDNVGNGRKRTKKSRAKARKKPGTKRLNGTSGRTDSERQKKQQPVNGANSEKPRFPCHRRGFEAGQDPTTTPIPFLVRHHFNDAERIGSPDGSLTGRACRPPLLGSLSKT